MTRSARDSRSQLAPSTSRWAAGFSVHRVSPIVGPLATGERLAPRQKSAWVLTRRLLSSTPLNLFSCRDVLLRVPWLGEDHHEADCLGCPHAHYRPWQRCRCGLRVAWTPAAPTPTRGRRLPR